MLDIQIKSFNALDVQTLYALLQLRNEVFVVEQNCVYQDIDGKDVKALHILGYKSSELVAYTRIFNAGDYVEKASIGRVLVVETQRKHQYGYEIMKASIKAVKEEFKTTEIQISAQCYLTKFYNNLGFQTLGESYLEDGIPHIEMLLEHA